MLLTLMSNLNMFGGNVPPPSEEVVFTKLADGVAGGGYGGLKALEAEEERILKEQEEQELVHHLASTFILWRN